MEKACQEYQNGQIWGPIIKRWDFMTVWSFKRIKKFVWKMLLQSKTLLSSNISHTNTFINGGTYYYAFVFMLIGPTGLTLVEIFFWIVPMAAGLILKAYWHWNKRILNLIYCKRPCISRTFFHKIEAKDRGCGLSMDTSLFGVRKNLINIHKTSQGAEK